MLAKSALVTQATGSIGGLTWSKSPSGHILRARSQITNPGTPAQNAQRSLLRTVNARWGHALSPAQRDAWNLYAANVPLRGKLGDDEFLSGHQHYVRTNTARLLAGLDLVDDGPTDYTLSTFTLPALAVDANTNSVDVTYDSDDAWFRDLGGAMLLSASRPHQATVNKIRTGYQPITMIPGTGGPILEMPANRTLPHPAAPGTKVFFNLKSTRSDGRISTHRKLSAPARRYNEVQDFDDQFHLNLILDFFADFDPVGAIEAGLDWLITDATGPVAPDFVYWAPPPQPANRVILRSLAGFTPPLSNVSYLGAGPPHTQVDGWMLRPFHFNLPFVPPL